MIADCEATDESLNPTPRNATCIELARVNGEMLFSIILVRVASRCQTQLHQRIRGETD